MSASRGLPRIAAAWLCALFWSCEGAAPAAQPNAGTAGFLSRDQLLDPEQCKNCHPQHYREWSSSMHAYAAQDPVFIAMNQRGQRDTGGELGPFCVNCHAPLAVAQGATRDGLNLGEVPAKLKGVTCYVCHNTIDVGEHFNNDLKLANDSIMRAAIDDPIASPAHALGYGRFQDSNRRQSSALCGSCHDVVTPTGVALERTFEEYESSLFGKLEDGFETCAGCHMPGRMGRAAELSGAPERTVHEHLWPAVDVALTPFPDQARQRQAVECELALNTRIRTLQHDGLGGFTVETETSAGHRQPSGAAQDRRMWLEVVAYDASDRVIFESGRIGDTELEDKAPSELGYDPQLALYRDWIYDANGQPTHDFWTAAASSEYPDGYASLTLPYTIDPGIPHTLTARFTIARHREIARMTVRLRLRPIGLDVLRDLVASADLDPGVLEVMPTFTLHGAALEWRPGEPTPRSLLPDDLACPKP